MTPAGGHGRSRPSPGDAASENPSAGTADDGRQHPARTEDSPVLPDVSTDETAEGWGERGEDDDDRYLRERPPHHLA